MTAGTETVQCACLPGAVCATCSARGYSSGLAGYAARIYPRLVTPADEAAELGIPYVAPECIMCGQPADGTVHGTVGGESGRLCDDCAFFCDGNVSFLL